MFTTLTNREGLYQLPALRATTYVVRFDAPGFAPAERTLTLLVGQTPTLDIEPQLASTTSAVNVVEDAAQIDTSSSAVAGRR